MHRKSQNVKSDRYLLKIFPPVLACCQNLIIFTSHVIVNQHRKFYNRLSDNTIKFWPETRDSDH